LPPFVVGGASQAAFDNPYQGYKRLEETDMPKSTEVVWWPQFIALIAVMIAVLGGGFAWLHSDMSELKGNFVDLTKQISDVRTEVGRTTGKLEIIVQEIQKRR
jgi:hypothetical protein